MNEVDNMRIDRAGIGKKDRDLRQPWPTEIEKRGTVFAAAELKKRFLAQHFTNR